MKITINKRIISSHLILSIFLFCVFLFSFAFFLVSNNKNRRIFIFPSVDEGKQVVEYRYLGRKPVQGEIDLYVDELLLGSQIERTKLLFTRGTEVISCFLRKNVLYLNLSGELLSGGDDATEIKNGFNLLELNLKKNFSGIEKIEFFVDGKYAFE